MRGKEETKHIKLETFIDEDEDETLTLYLARNRRNGPCEGEETQRESVIRATGAYFLRLQRMNLLRFKPLARAETSKHTCGTYLKEIKRIKNVRTKGTR